MFSKAITKTPAPSMVKGITTASLGIPDYELALEQHQNYIKALKDCGLDVTVMESDNRFPDSTFVEDTALITPHCAILTRPGADSRRDEIIKMDETLNLFYPSFERISAKGTVDAGDIMMVGNHYFIGLSDRTNAEGANQMINILQKYGMTGSTVKMQDMLHLKTGLSYLEGNNLLVTGEFVDEPQFKDFNKLIVSGDEAYAANSVWVNGTVLVPEGFPETLEMIQARGYNTLVVDVSEFQKLDGGLSCLSLRF